MDATADGSGARATGRLRIIVRSHGGEGLKPRPPFFSKMLGLVSLVRAIRECGPDPDVIFWNDGPLPDDRLALMRTAGAVARLDAGSNRASYRAAIDLAATSDWPDDDLVWFAEDDYLYQPDTFRHVLAAAAAIPDLDYLSAFGNRAIDPGSPRTATAWFPGRGAQDTPAKVEVGGVTWYRGVSTTSTFGVRLRVLREDRTLLRLLPFSGGAWDHTTCMTLQGRTTFDWDELREDVLPFGSVPPARWPVAMARGAVRVAVNLRSRRAPERCRTLYLADPVLAQHMELPIGTRGPLWESLAGQTGDWAAREGIDLRAPLAEAGALT